MAQPYLKQLQQLVSLHAGSVAELNCKHFFSGAALYYEQMICASLTPKGLAFKLPPERCDGLIAQGKALPLQYFDSSPIKKGYALFPDYTELKQDETSSYFRECLLYNSKGKAC